MIEEWFSTVELPITFEQFEQLPQNPAYKYEYFGGRAWLTPRAKMHHALLDLRSYTRSIPDVATREELSVRPMAEDDWERLPPLFAAAFHRVQPFASLGDEERLRAAEGCLGQTREGAEGPVIGEAGFVAVRDSDGALIGAVLTTLAPEGDPTKFGSWRWREPPPPDAVTRRLGRPHLTWIFVAPFHARLGVGTALLDATAGGLKRLGYPELTSTFLLGNESSTLWHWRAGFRLLPYPGSMRLLRQQASSNENGSGTGIETRSVSEGPVGSKPEA